MIAWDKQLLFLGYNCFFTHSCLKAKYNIGPKVYGHLTTTPICTHSKGHCYGCWPPFQSSLFRDKFSSRFWRLDLCLFSNKRNSKDIHWFMWEDLVSLPVHRRVVYWLRWGIRSLLCQPGQTMSLWALLCAQGHCHDETGLGQWRELIIGTVLIDFLDGWVLPTF